MEWRLLPISGKEMLDFSPEIKLFINLPSPTKQHFIDQAKVLEEFKGFLHACIDDPIEKKHLIFNFQDRTSWQEYARSHVLEELQKNAEYAKNINVVTLTKNSDFYYQYSPYHLLNDANDFIIQFNQHIHSGIGGFFFPKNIAEIITHKRFQL